MIQSCSFLDEMRLKHTPFHLTSADRGRKGRKYGIWLLIQNKHNIDSLKNIKLQSIPTQAWGMGYSEFIQ